MPAHYWKDGINRETTPKVLQAFNANKGRNYAGGDNRYNNKQNNRGGSGAY